MPNERNSKGEELVSVVRVLEYHGTKAWIKATLASSRLHVVGRSVVALRNDAVPFPDGCYINSGQVMWEEPTPDVIEDRELIPIPPGSGSVQ